MVDTLVVIPTYNASQTIVPLIKNILSQSKRIAILLVDDNSPDGTAAIVKQTFHNKKNVILLQREKKGGRGSAVIEGFQKGLKQRSYLYFIEMDADLCHDPKYIPQLIKACTSYDVAIASRYEQKSKIIGWKLKRRILSTITNSVLKTFLKLPITDYTNGYRCYRKEALTSINLYSIRSKGFITLSELAYLLYKKGARFTQVPITFIFEEKNKSNLNIQEMKEGLQTIFRLTLSYN